VFRAIQEPGDFIITLPRSYHGGFGNGFNVGEAVNFAMRDWFPFGMDSTSRYRGLQRVQLLAFEHLLTLEALQMSGVFLRFRSAEGPDGPNANTYINTM
jgi:hypothetical protein